MAEPAPTDDLQVLPQGHVAVPQARLDQLEAAFRRGGESQQRIAAMRFDASFRAAIADGRAVPAMETVVREIFNANEDLGLRLIAAFPQMVNVAPIGASAHDTPDTPDGYDPQNYAIHLKVQAYQREHPDVTYTQALDAVVED